MRDKYKLVVGSLLGAVAIHAALVACGGGGGGTGKDGGMLADAGKLADAMRDAISHMMGDSTTKDAHAGSDAGSSSCRCTTSGAVKSVTADTDSHQLQRGTIMPPPGAVSSYEAKVTEGPFVLTDFNNVNQTGFEQVYLALFPTASACPAPSTGTCSSGAGTSAGTNYACSSGSVLLSGAAAVPDSINPGSGLRQVVPAGQMLCAEIIANSSGFQPVGASWAGFAPYE